jgi:hypothetical protein
VGPVGPVAPVAPVGIPRLRAKVALLYDDVAGEPTLNVVTPTLNPLAILMDALEAACAVEAELAALVAEVAAAL